jgi:hypothetical protein
MYQNTILPLSLMEEKRKEKKGEKGKTYENTKAALVITSR